MAALKAVIALALSVLAVGLGFVAYEWYQGSIGFPTINRSSTNNNTILDQRVSLNETYDERTRSHQYNPIDPYPFESKGYDLQLFPGTYQVTVHTTGTVAVSVKMDRCYDETLYHCTRLAEGFTPSENPPNIKTFTITQTTGYTLTVALPGGTPAATGCGQGPYRNPCPTADVEIIVTRL
jgi:hypothetical protein